MKEKQYLISESELRELIKVGTPYTEKPILTSYTKTKLKNLIKSKQSITLIAKGKVEHLECQECNEGWMIGNSTTYSIFGGLKGKNIKIYMEMAK